MSNKAKTEQLEGFNPKMFRTLSLIFIILTFLNVGMVLIFFRSTGYGLWHAEDSIVKLAKIDNDLENINTYILDIYTNFDDTQKKSEMIEAIDKLISDIYVNEADFKAIDTKSVDPNLQNEFDVVMLQVRQYLDSLKDCTDKVMNGKMNREEFKNAAFYNKDRSESSVNVSILFENQDNATYAFFCKTGQSFLIVIGFLLLTMGLALVAIEMVKKRERNNALKLQESNAKTIAMREKAENIAYINIITGLKNRYALDEELQNKLGNSDFSIALYNFNNFNTLNESYGRQFADEFIASISGTMVEKFKDIAEFYSTSINEFCVIFNNDIPKHKIEDAAWQIIDTLSRTTHVHNQQIKMTVSGCLYHYNAGDHKNANSVFMSLDKGLNFARRKGQFDNQSTLVPITK